MSNYKYLTRYSLSSFRWNLQRRAGTARHDAVAWGYARGADEMGVDIIQNCEVRGIKEMAIWLKELKQQKDLSKQKNWSCSSWSLKCNSEYGWIETTFGK